MENFILIVAVACIPALLVAGSMYIVLQRNLKADEKRRDTELLLASKRVTLPVRSQAYERLILFLERISPDGMLVRLRAPMQQNSDLHLAILQTIRSEYEHNLSQQLYVSIDIWDKVKQTKEEVVSFINDCAKETDPIKPSIDLSKHILDRLVENGNSLVEQAIVDIKKEAAKYL